MTHHVQHQYDEILQAALPGLEVHVIYNCESEIVFDENGDEESNRLLTISATVNGAPAHLPAFPRETSSQDEKRFLARLKESARQALWASAMRQVPDTADKISRANHFLATGKIRFPVSIGKPERDFIV